MKRAPAILVAIMIMGLISADLSWGVRIKDIASIKGVRSNQLIGYGIVVGLDGSGDDDKTQFTRQSLVSMLDKMGIVVNPEDVKIDNVAAVMVTASLPTFAKAGSRIDVVVSSIGNADTLQGGTLLMTPLKAPNGDVYAVAQGSISIGGFSFGGAAGGGVQKNHPTVGHIPEGAIIEKDVPVELTKRPYIEISLQRPDFTTCMRMQEAISRSIGGVNADAVDAGTVRVKISEDIGNNMVAFISGMENLDITPDRVAKIVLNERTGTVVMGERVRIATVAVAHGNLSIVIKEQPRVSQPLPFSGGETAVVPQTEIEVREQKTNLIVIPEGASIGDVVRGLNAIGVSPRDLIAIMQAIKASGALQAELEVI